MTKEQRKVRNRARQRLRAATHRHGMCRHHRKDRDIYGNYQGRHRYKEGNI